MVLCDCKDVLPVEDVRGQLEIPFDLEDTIKVYREYNELLDGRFIVRRVVTPTEL
jgi:hypothetical protein